MRSSFKTDQMRAIEKPDTWKKPTVSHFQDTQKNEQETLAIIFFSVFYWWCCCLWFDHILYSWEQ